MQLKDVVAMRKRTQIAQASRMMFIWVAIVSVIVGFAIVATIFLTQKLLFNEKILTQKEKTVATLNANNKVVSELEAQVRALDSNQALIGNKASPDDQAVQVILDALPSDANSPALGASLQQKLLANIAGLTVESLQVDPVAGIETATGSASSTTSSTVNSTENQITFRLSVSGDETALKQVLQRLESSIRTIDIQTLTIESQSGKRILTIQARAFYEPAKVVELKDKTVKP